MGTHGRWLFGLVAWLVVAAPALTEAVVRGMCSDCHTMHNSQEGSIVAFTVATSGQRTYREEAFGNLLKTDCLGCHSNPGAETLNDLGGSRAPVVLNLTEPAYPPDGSSTSTLAGGNFHWLLKNGDAYGHNVHGIAAEDPRFSPSLAPGGVPRVGECANCHGTLATPQSGCNGCHVTQHHAAGSGVVAKRDQGWYRFLGAVMQRTSGMREPTLQGVVGIEEPTWEQSPLPGRHNAYQGRPGPYTSFLESGAISQKCVGCHGRYHSETLADAVWIRHPVETVIPNAGEFASFTTYNPLVPVARQGVADADANFTTINRGSDVVTCVSCHRPHGSPYPAMLRWNFQAWPGTDPQTGGPAVNGCAVCHTAKD